MKNKKRMALFYRNDYNRLCQRLLPELKKIVFQPERYKRLVLFLVLAEDIRYYSHPGFDTKGICRAAYRDLFCGKREGASTIEQQLVRVLTNDYRYSIFRKIKEVYLATKLKRFADKYTLAAVYLNIASYGTDLPNLYAVLDKFGETLRQDLSPSICAEIVARLKYPEPRSYNPARMGQIERRKNYIVQLYNRNIENECR